MNRLAEILHSGAQGASNGAASGVYSSVDMLAAALRKAGIPVPDDPVMGEQWMRQIGLIQEPKNKLAGAIGEGLGLGTVGAMGMRLAK